MNIDQAEYRYNNDATFYQLVEMFYQFMHELRFTHEDLRSAAFLAAVQIEERKVSPLPGRCWPGLVPRTKVEPYDRS